MASSSASFSEQVLSPPEHFDLMSWKRKNELDGKQFCSSLQSFLKLSWFKFRCCDAPGKIYDGKKNSSDVSTLSLAL